ncbi:MAG: methyltransferase domain-containing protein [Gammaproteobacteria bacterium]|nr:methyltransferase domain-containing protein [Gammaproteobacteria bacterium]
MNHDDAIRDQFTRQAALFAAAPELHNDAIHRLMIDAAAPRASDRMLDVACGPGTVVAAFAPHVAQAIGVDATPAMLAQARSLTAERALANVEWQLSSAYALPFAPGHFDIVTNRFAFHHLEDIAAAFAEMLRVTAVGGRVVVCDGIASTEPAKAAAFNAMERWRDPSTVEFRQLAHLRALFARAELGALGETLFRVPYPAADLVAASFPADDDRDGLLAHIEASIADDALGMLTRREGGKVMVSYAGVVLWAERRA